MTERVWRLQDAKTNLSELIELATRGEPQVVTTRGKRAVLVSAAEYARLKGRDAAAPADFVHHLLGAPKGDLVAPRRSKKRLRPTGP